MTIKSIACTIAFLFLIVFNVFAQQDLTTLSYQQLKDSIETYDYPESYIIAFQQKAKQDKDTIQIAQGLFFKTFLVDDEGGLILSDSIIALTKNHDHRIYPALGYLLKAFYLYSLGQDEKSIPLLLKGYDYALKHNNIEQQLHIKGQLGSLYANINQHEKSIKIFKEQAAFLKTLPQDNKTYNQERLYTISSIANGYLRAEQPDSVLPYIKKGLPLAKAINDKEELLNLRTYYAQYLMHKKHYKSALDSLKVLAPLRKEDTNLSMNYHNQAIIYKALGYPSKVITYYEKMDSLYQINKRPYLEHKEVYKTLYDHYFEQGDKNKQLHAVNMLIEADSIFSEISLNINSRPLENYDISQLKEEQEKLLQNVQRKKHKNGILELLAFAILVASIVSLVIFYISKKRLKQKFENLLAQQHEAISKPDATTISKKTLHIPKQTITSILERLDDFENKLSYLDNNITLNSLAKSLNTNSVYLSKIINQYKNQSFTNYLTTLRIKHCTEILKTNITLRNYTVKALALEMGFKSAESFSKAFKKQTGLNPSYYIKALNKLKEDS